MSRVSSCYVLLASGPPSRAASAHRFAACLLPAGPPMPFSYANPRSMWHIHTSINSLNCHHGSEYDMTDFKPAVNESLLHRA